MKDYDKIAIEIYQKMYQEAKPKANFKELMKKGITKKPMWFMKYTLNGSRQEEILQNICTKYKLSELELRKMRTEIMLGCSPKEP